MKACCILHHMTANDRGYEGSMKLQKEMEDDSEMNLHLNRVVRVKYIRKEFKRYREEYVDGEDKNGRGEVTKSLIEHICHGSAGIENFAFVHSTSRSPLGSFLASIRQVLNHYTHHYLQ